MGRDSLLAKLHRKLHWPNMAKSVIPIIRTCSRCQQFGCRILRAPVNPVTVLCPVQLLSMDYFSLPTSKRRFKSVLVVIDYFSRYIWVYKMKGEGTGKKTVESLVDLFHTFGAPKVLMSDGGGHLDCKEVNSFCTAKGVVRSVTPVYQPHTNGAVEGANRIILKVIERSTLR